jgi:hypothetical protein
MLARCTTKVSCEVSPDQDDLDRGHSAKGMQGGEGDENWQYSKRSRPSAPICAATMSKEVLNDRFAENTNGSRFARNEKSDRCRRHISVSSSRTQVIPVGILSNPLSAYGLYKILKLRCCPQESRSINAFRYEFSRTHSLPHAQRSKNNKDKRKIVRCGVPTWLMNILICTCSIMMLQVGSAQQCELEHNFRVNDVPATCKDNGELGAIPKGINASTFAYDFGKIPASSDRVSLVRSTIKTYVVCSDLNINIPGPTTTTSGHMRHMTENTANALIMQADSEAAIAKMEEGVYDVCFFTAGQWRNMGIGLVVQTELLGLEVMGISHAGGTRLSVPFAILHPVSVRPLGILTPLDQITIILPGLPCKTAPVSMPTADHPTSVRGNPTASGFLNYSVATGSFANVNRLAGMFQTLYQVCFRKGGSQIFTRTGISLLVHQDISIVEVNGVTPNAGVDLSIPAVRKNIINFRRLPLEFGYQQTVQFNKPVAHYAFEETDPNGPIMNDIHCEFQTCDGNDFNKDGIMENGKRAATLQRGEGLYKYLICNGENTIAYTTSNMTFPTLAMSLSFGMRWDLQVGIQTSMKIIAPLKKKINDWEEGDVSVALRVDPDASQTGKMETERRLELVLFGFTDTNQGSTGANTLLFNYRFARDIWYFVVITIDLKKDGIARLYVDGKQEPDVTKNKFEHDLKLYPPAPYLRMGPVSIGAYHDGRDLYQVFKGFLDEVHFALSLSWLHEACGLPAFLDCVRVAGSVLFELFELP